VTFQVVFRNFYLLFGIVFTLAVALVLASMSAAGIVTMMLARLLLAIAWVVAIVTLLLAPPVRELKPSKK
jgi:hypothetical protein